MLERIVARNLALLRWVALNPIRSNSALKTSLTGKYAGRNDAFMASLIAG